MCQSILARIYILIQADIQFGGPDMVSWTKSRESRLPTSTAPRQHMPSSQMYAHQAHWPVAGSLAWRTPLRRQGEWPTLASCQHEQKSHGFLSNARTAYGGHQQPSWAAVQAMLAMHVASASASAGPGRRAAQRPPVDARAADFDANAAALDALPERLSENHCGEHVAAARRRLHAGPGARPRCNAIKLAPGRPGGSVRLSRQLQHSVASLLMGSIGSQQLQRSGASVPRALMSSEPQLRPVRGRRNRAGQRSTLANRETHLWKSLAAPSPCLDGLQPSGHTRTSSESSSESLYDELLRGGAPTQHPREGAWALPSAVQACTGTGTPAAPLPVCTDTAASLESPALTEAKRE